MYARLCSGHGLGEPRNLGIYNVQARHGMLLMPWHQSSLPALHSCDDGLGSEKAEAEFTCLHVFKTHIHSQLLVLWCSGYAHGTSESLLCATRRELQCQHTPRPENLIL